MMPAFIPQDLSRNDLTECPRELENAKNMLVLNLGHNRWGSGSTTPLTTNTSTCHLHSPLYSGSPSLGWIQCTSRTTLKVPMSPQHRDHPQPAFHQPHGPALP